MTRTRVGLILALTVLGALAAVPASAQDYPPDAATCAVSVTTPVQGQTIEVTCNGWMPNGEVDVTLLSEPRHLDTIQTDANGELTRGVTIPSDLEPGRHTLRLSGLNAQGEEQQVDIALNIQDAGAQRNGLAATGMDSGAGVLLGLGLLGAGAAAVYGARRRQAKIEA